MALEPLSAENLCAILKVSRASVSTNFRLLLNGRLAEKVSLPGDRTTYYVFPETGLEKTLIAESQSLGVMKKLAEQGLRALLPEDSARTRMESLIQWTDFLIEIWQRALSERQARQQSNAHH